MFQRVTINNGAMELIPNSPVPLRVLTITATDAPQQVTPLHVRTRYVMLQVQGYRLRYSLGGGSLADSFLVEAGTVFLMNRAQALAFLCWKEHDVAHPATLVVQELTVTGQEVVA